jgi:hypothetical protein
MRLCRPPWTLSGWLLLIFILIISMVSCGALHCSWKKDTDFRGLSRHCSICKHYLKASTLATQKRRDRATESTKKLQKSTQLTTTASTSSTSDPSVSHLCIISLPTKIVIGLTFHSILLLAWAGPIHKGPLLETYSFMRI